MSGGFCFAKELRHALCLQADNGFGLLANHIRGRATRVGSTTNRSKIKKDTECVLFYFTEMSGFEPPRRFPDLHP